MNITNKQNKPKCANKAIVAFVLRGFRALSCTAGNPQLVTTYACIGSIHLHTTNQSYNRQRTCKSKAKYGMTKYMTSQVVVTTYDFWHITHAVCKTGKTQIRRSHSPEVEELVRGHGTIDHRHEGQSHYWTSWQSCQ